MSSYAMTLPTTSPFMVYCLLTAAAKLPVTVSRKKSSEAYIDTAEKGTNIL